MGLDLHVYTRGLSAELLPKIKKRFTDYAMNIEFHPNFKFNEKRNGGFCPIKLNLHPGQSSHYDNFRSDIITGFELLFDDYNYQDDLKGIQNETSQKSEPSFLSKLFGSNKNNSVQENYVFDKETDKLLKQCNKSLMLTWQTYNKSELRISLFFAAILAELTGGVIYDPQGGRHLTGPQALATFPNEIKEYEDSFAAEEFTLYNFEEWS